VGPRAYMDEVNKRKFLTLPGLEILPLRRPTCGQSLYRLRYPNKETCFIKLQLPFVDCLGDVRDRSVGIATGYRLDGGVQFPAGARDFSLFRSVQAGSGAHPASYKTATRGSLPVGKVDEART
jgi:hypothetical protein